MWLPKKKRPFLYNYVVLLFIRLLKSPYFVGEPTRITSFPKMKVVGDPSRITRFPKCEAGDQTRFVIQKITRFPNGSRSGSPFFWWNKKRATAVSQWASNDTNPNQTWSNAMQLIFITFLRSFFIVADVFEADQKWSYVCTIVRAWYDINFIAIRKSSGQI